MSRYDGLIIPRSYSEYINKTDAATLQQALQLSGVMDNAPTAQSTKPAKSGGVFAANAVTMTSGPTLSGVAISAGSVVRVLFSAELTGSDATTGLTLTYNGNAYAVKVGKNGALAAFVASEISTGVFKYLQAYTILELAFDGTQFIIVGNPVVISSDDYTIYANGEKQLNRLWQGTIMPNDNFNNFTDFGSYFVQTGVNNAPSNTFWGVLFVFPANYEVLQVFLGTTAATFGKLYYRLRYDETSWTSWYYVTGTSA